MIHGLLTNEQILSVGRKLMELRPLNDVLTAVLDAAIETMNADTGAIFLRQGKQWVAVTNKHGAETPDNLQISQSLLEEAVSKNTPVLTESAVTDPRFSGKSSIILQNIQAAVIIPLTIMDEVIGVIYLDSRHDRAKFHRDNISPLTTLAAFSALAIENSRRLETAKRSAGKGSQSQLLVGWAPVMQELYAMIARVAPSDLAVLILGKSGTGKELVAREIHLKSPRAKKPFVPLYCGNVSPQLFESELFGHKRGAFTGATGDKQGLVEAAKGGTLFLDEVADIPTDVQNKLLRFLQDSEYRAVGDTETKKADVRIITATNKNLKHEADAGRFRGDLYFRLYILPILAPTLAERISDIPFLVQHFIEKYAKPGGPKGISQLALRRLMNYGWPGNVRELENTIARALVVTKSDRIEVEDIWLQDEKLEPQDWSLKTAERKHILQVLTLCDGNKSRAAQVLGVSRRHVHNRLNEWGLSGKDEE